MRCNNLDTKVHVKVEITIVKRGSNGVRFLIYTICTTLRLCPAIIAIKYVACARTQLHRENDNGSRGDIAIAIDSRRYRAMKRNRIQNKARRKTGNFVEAPASSDIRSSGVPSSFVILRYNVQRALHIAISLPVSFPLARARRISLFPYGIWCTPIFETLDRSTARNLYRECHR